MPARPRTRTVRYSTSTGDPHPATGLLADAEARRLVATWDGLDASWAAHAAPFLRRYPEHREVLARARWRRVLADDFNIYL